jgi:prepilin-type N-terminal cleavage/methylation domain-containing protein
MLKAVCRFRKSKKGFTLIELLIVVAIIAILAAIAIPQFSQYRVRGYNAAASSDMRNIKVQTEAYNTDWQIYASSTDAGAAGLGTVRSGPTSLSLAVPEGTIVVASPGLPSADTTFTFGLSNGVRAAINTSVGGAGYTAMSKHTSGDRGFAADDDVTSINWKTINAGVRLEDSDRVASDAGDNITTDYPTAM